MRNDWTGRSEVSVFRNEVSRYLVMRIALKFHVDLGSYAVECQIGRKQQRLHLELEAADRFQSFNHTQI